MTDDDRFLADVCRLFGRPAPLFDAVANSEVVTAAVISKSKLFLVSLKCGAGRPPLLDDAGSVVLELRDRSGRAVNSLAREANGFFSAKGISQVFLRSRCGNGKYAGHPFGFKVETILQMVPGLRVDLVNSNSIGAWARREEPCLPEGPRDLGAYDYEQRRLAIETALFVSENRDRSQYFTDGSADDD